MRLFWWRGKKDKAGDSQSGRQAGRAPALPVAEPAAPIVRDDLLVFARDYLLARGARVRIEQDDVIAGTLPDGTEERFTTSPARMADFDDARLLVPGSTELAEMLDDVARESRVVALSLVACGNATEIARETVGEPPRTCGRCPAAGGEQEGAPCEACPLRDGQFAFAGLGAVRRAREQREREGWSAEAVFQVTARDRAGRLDDTVRVALDLDTGMPVSPLSHETIEAATGEPAPAWAHDRLCTALEAAQAQLRPVLSATAAFLDVRSRAAFLHRWDEIASTASAMRREPGNDPDAIERSLAVELRRLEDVFAVQVEASVASVAFIRTRLVDVALERADGREAVVTVDIGRGTVVPPTCAVCGVPCRHGEICREAHVVCAQCSAAGGEVSGCRACADGAAGTRPNRELRRATGGGHADECLTRAAFRALPEVVWRACVEWTVKQRGIAVDRMTAGESGVTLNGAREGCPVLAVAIRDDDGRPIGVHEVRRAAALASGRPETQCILLFPSAAAPEARLEAERLGVELWDGSLLEGTASGAAERYGRDRADAAEERARRLVLARGVRAELVAEMEAIEAALTTGAGGPALSGQRRVVKASQAVQDARGVLLQAFAAWETAAGDYLAAFGERADRHGSLAVVATTDALASLQERIRHLAAVTREAGGRVGESPAKGELGYSGWRKAVVEELVARCEAVRWRALSLDPDKADDFAAAHDGQASLKVEEAVVAAARAAMRAEAAYAQLSQRARL